MPQYKVIADGFYGDKLYSPTGKRRVLHTDKPLKPVPSWVKAIAPETAAEKKKRLAVEKVAEKADAEKAEQDQKDIGDATFLGEGESESGSAVETI